MNLYGLIGYPIFHSLSPAIYHLFARQCHQTLDYRLWPAHVGEFDAVLRELRLKSVRGFNVTAPLKQEAYRGVTRLTPRALRAGAVNTVRILTDGTTEGDNTDGIGLFVDLTQRLAFSLKGRRIALIGAGGAACGIVPTLLDAAPETVVVYNRTQASADAMVARFRGKVFVAGSEAARLPFDLILNSTGALGAEALLKDIEIRSGALAYDLAYGQGETSFMAWASHRGIKRINDGLGMLVAQAAESFYVFCGVRPEISPVLSELCAKS